MKLSELQPRQGKIDIIVIVENKDEPRTFERYGKEGRVCNAKVKDESGTMKLTLWNDEIDMVNEGDKIHIINGYVNEFQGEMSLTAGKFGKIEIIKE